MNFRPVFISGCDRSGTTMLGDMLGNTRWTVTTPESQFIHEMILHFQLNTFETARDVAKWLNNNFRFAAWGLQTNLDELESLVDIDKPRDTIENIISLYVQQVHPGKAKADVWVDHTPDNFKFYAILKSLFPEARFIHIARDGRAVCASIKQLDWGPNNAYSASRFWAERLQQALAVEAAEAGNCQRIYFENLVTEPESSLKHLCSLVDIPYEDDMINGGGLILPGFTQNQHKMVGQKPQLAKANQWRTTLSQQEIRDFESYSFSRTLLEKLGYDLIHARQPRLSTMHILNRYCHEFIQNIRNRLRHRKMEQRTVKEYTYQLNEKNGLFITKNNT